MNQVNYAAMSDEELKRYFLQHRDDKMAFRAYLDRVADRPHQMITTIDDPDFEAKLAAVIRHKMQDDYCDE